jgi:hypothetical protein
MFRSFGLYSLKTAEQQTIKTRFKSQICDL